VERNLDYAACIILRRFRDQLCFESFPLFVFTHKPWILRSFHLWTFLCNVLLFLSFSNSFNFLSAVFKTLPGVLRIEIFPRHMFSIKNLFKKNVFVTIYKNQNYIKWGFLIQWGKELNALKNMSFAGTFNPFRAPFVKYTYKSIYDLNLSRGM